MARKNQTRNRAFMLVLVLVAAYMVGIFQPLGYPSPIGVNLLSGDIQLPNGQMAPQKFTLSKRGTSTAIESATVYAAYDWNGNGMIDLGAYPEGEIEELTSATTSGLVTTTVEYPIGRPVFYQVHKSGYEVETFSRQRDSLPSAYDGSALVVPSCYLTLTDTYTSQVRVQGGAILVTSSGDYNQTLSGDEPTFVFEATSVSTDAGLNEQAYTHWGTGDVYAGTVVAITVTNQDYIDLGLAGAGISGFFVGATNTVCWFNVAGYFNDAGIDNDNVLQVPFKLNILADGDIAAIGIYSGMEMKNLLVGTLNTPIATHETTLEIRG